MPFLSGVFAKITVLGLGADLLLFLSLVVASFIYTALLGRRRVLLYLTSVYVTLGVLAYAPFVGRIAEVTTSPNKTIYFVVAFIVLFFILVRGVLGQVFIDGGYVSGWWQVLGLAFLQLGLLVSIFLSFLPNNLLNVFSPFTRTVFLDSWGRFAWLIIPIVLMAALARKDDE